MTDLPELQHLLIEAAAGRRRRRARRRTAALVVTAALAVALVPRAGGEDREIPAVPAPAPYAAPTTVESAFGVFRRRATAQEREVRFAAPRLPEIRRIASTPRTDVYLGAARDRLCFAVMPAGRRSGGVAGCGAPQGYLDGHNIHVGTFLPVGRTASFAAAFPDGVDSVTLTLEGGDRLTLPVRSNGAAGELPARPVAIEWRAPDGQEQKIDYRSTKPLRASDLFSTLRRPAQGGDELAGPGARQLLGANSVTAWLAPHGDGGVCLLVRVKNREARRCRAQVNALEPPLMVAVRGGGGGRVVAAAFSDRVPGFSVEPDKGIDRMTKTYGAMIWADGGERRQLRYELIDGLHRVAIPGYSTTRPSSP